MTYQFLARGLDELLLDIATIIELSDNDRRVADRRYGLLKQHLERPSSPLSEILKKEDGLIYAQGSMAIGATIVSGTDDDRFDVDALVDSKMPSDWSPKTILDTLEEALQGFPGVHKIVRCTRCIQLRFAFMHMDVTILDPAKSPRIERVGEICHSPDKSASNRVPSNPYGFSVWYRSEVHTPTPTFAEDVRRRRDGFAVDRLPASTFAITADAAQEDLPSIIPPRLDSPQVVALKLMKRFLNIRYSERDLKRPPSIYLTKKSADCGFSPEGLTAQLERFAICLRDEMRTALARQSGPDERNPSYDPDKINDRWPSTQADRKTLFDDMNVLLTTLSEARNATVGEIRKALAVLFGEKVSTRAYERMSEKKPSHVAIGSGAVLSSSAPAAAAIPSHRFHCE